MAVAPSTRDLTTIVLGVHHHLPHCARFLCDHLDTLLALGYRHISLDLPQDAEVCTREDLEIAEILFSALGKENYTKIYTDCLAQEGKEGLHGAICAYKTALKSSAIPQLQEAVSQMDSDPKLSLLTYEAFMSYHSLKYQLEILRLARTKDFKVTLLGSSQAQMHLSIEERVYCEHHNLEKLLDSPGKKIILTGAWHAAKLIDSHSLTPFIFPEVYKEVDKILEEADRASVARLTRVSAPELLGLLGLETAKEEHPSSTAFLTHEEKTSAATSEKRDESSPPV